MCYGNYNKPIHRRNQQSIVSLGITYKYKTYKICQFGSKYYIDEVILYPIKFMNSLDPSAGLPSHKLTLEIGVPIMLFWILKPSRLHDDTRLQIMGLMHYIIETIILTGPELVK